MTDTIPMLRDIADLLRGRAVRKENEADEHREAGEHGQKAQLIDEARNDRYNADKADDLADYLEGGE